MLKNAEPARRWHGERLPDTDQLGSAISLEDNPAARLAQRLALRFGLTPHVADVIATHLFGRAA